MLAHWIWLAHRDGVSNRMKKTLLEYFADPEDIYCCDSFEHVPGLTEKAVQGLMDKDLGRAERILADCRREALHIVTYRDAAYPGRLKNIPDPPVVLYYKGTLPDFDGNAVIGVVGTRQASPYGITAAKRLGWQIARCGGIVVSGMAFGIDGVAMRGALSAGGTVVGVLGCGAEQVYPPSNSALFADTRRYGCILSEFAPGTPPKGSNFPQRNRIISGLSCGVLVVEAPEKSGSLITARQALDQGRDVFVVPGNIDVPTFAGSFALLREGGIPVRTGWDVMSEYEAMFPGTVRRDTSPSLQTGYEDEAEQPEAEDGNALPRVAEKRRVPGKKSHRQKENDKKGIDNGDSAPYIDLNKAKPALSEDEQRIVDAIGSGQKLIDDVIAASGLGSGRVLTLLTILTVRGIVRRLPGNRVQRV